MQEQLTLWNETVSQWLAPVAAVLGDKVTKVIGAVVLLIVGWFLALVIRLLVRRGLRLLDLNEKIKAATHSEWNVELWVTRLVYYLLLALVFIAFFDALDLKMVSEPLQALTTQVFAYLPKLFAGLGLTLLAWLLALLGRISISKLLEKSRLTERLAAEPEGETLAISLGNIVFWLILLIFLPAILEAFELKGLLGPVQNMVNKVLAMLPNIFGALVLGFVGWLVARILRDLVTNILDVSGVNTLGRKAGLTGEMTLSKLVGTLVFIFVLIPALIAALNALQIEAISEPATQMLSAILTVIPNLIAAALILGIAWFVAKLVSGLTVNILSGVGFDQLPQRLGLPWRSQEGAMTPSILAGRLLTFFILLFAFVEATNRLGLSQVSELVSYLIRFGGKILLGSIILIAGFWLANLAYTAISRASPEGRPNPLAQVARVAIMLVVTAMGLREMGIAEDIVNAAFVLTLGAVAVAFALAFGLGAREAAGDLARRWVEKMR
ncbi:MAG TPA: hypothetical protein ENJ86_02745 [Methylothermaceae bacterium]|nr:hypothetical protein [Methylothermaceae bacterium]